MSIKYWDTKLYPLSEQRDPCVAFIKRISRQIRPDSSVLDIGAGAGERNSYEFRGHCKQMIGVDVDPRVTENPLLDEGVQADANHLPFDDARFDIAFSIYVLEHVEDPISFCSEVARVLKSGGEFWAITPNRIHYVPLIARLTPTRFHKWLNKKRGRDADDTFPTLYRLNSPSALRKHFRAAGMEEIEIACVEFRPNYLGFTLPTFLIGAAYERIVNSSQLFSRFRVNYLVGFRKTKSTGSTT